MSKKTIKYKTLHDIIIQHTMFIRVMGPCSMNKRLTMMQLL